MNSSESVRPRPFLCVGQATVPLPHKLDAHRLVVFLEEQILNLERRGRSLTASCGMGFRRADTYTIDSFVGHSGGPHTSGNASADCRK